MTYRPSLIDKLKPCGGTNSNICVAEGCYAYTCLSLILDNKDKDVLE